jgi:hypothetical protein
MCSAVWNACRPHLYALVPQPFGIYRFLEIALLNHLGLDEDPI